MIKFTYVGMIVLVVGVVIGIIVMIPSVETPFEVIELSTSKCLDGTNYQFLYSKGKVNKFLIYFQGGGLCGTDGKEFLESCEGRAKTELGSTKYWNYFVLHVVSRYTRFFSRKESYNPQFYNWNKVYVKYCDGMVFSGNVDAPVKGPTGVDLFFNGEKNVKGTIDYLKSTFQFKDAEEVVITGSSAGGMGASMWGNHISKQLSKPENAYIINDSGFPLDYPNKNNKRAFKDLLEAMIKNTQGDKYFSSSDLLKTYCPEESAATMWKCYLPEFYIHNVVPPMLLMHSPYDSWMEVNLAGINCIQKSFRMLNICSDEDQKGLLTYANKFTEIVTTAQKARKKDMSLWMPHTFTHTFMIMTDNWDNAAWKVEGTNLTFVDTIKEWRILAKEKRPAFLHKDKTMNKLTTNYIKDRYWWIAYLKTI